MQSEAPVSIPSVPDGPVASVTDVELAPDLASMYDDPPIRVVEGSALLFDPLPSPCSTGGYDAVLQVTDELAPVMRGYLEQFETAGFSGSGLVGDADESFIDMGISGGGGVSAVGVAGNLSHILISRCND